MEDAMKGLLTILALAGLCGAADLKTGAPAPPLTLSQVLQAPSGTTATWEALKGNAVVLEFWATWCGGCRDQIPLLNRLEEQFRNKPVRFLSLTDEEPALVQRFLKDYPISGWIGLDSNEQTFKRYEIPGRPTTVLVDAAGLVRAIGHPLDLTGEIMENLVAGKPIVISREAAPSAKLQALPEPFYQVMIRPAGPAQVTGNGPGLLSGKAGKRWEIWGVSLLRLVYEAYGVAEQRIDAPAWATPAGQPHYDVALAAPDLTATRRLELLRRGLEETFQLKVHKESRETDVYVLSRRPGMEPKLRPATSGASSSWGKTGDITAVSRTVPNIQSLAEQALGKTVVNETGLTGRFDFELKWDTAKPQSLIEAVRNQLGLELSSSRRPLEYLVVDSAVEPQAW
jgi:uncharacterized protein (TIGR03435 family)